MLPLLTHTFARRAITAVLALWLCVVAAGVWAPLARAQQAAQGMELLCSGHGEPVWVPSPAAQIGHANADMGADALHHLLDCPLCLPVLAPPPRPYASASSPLAQSTPVAAAALGPQPQDLPWPPARGPPVAPALG